jgi:ABC-type phosphate/phosphonate transport system permease subunit
VVLNVLRSVPELVWATITALAVGLGPFAGALALALHTTGVLGRLFAEALQNAPAAPRMRSGSAAAIACWHFATAPCPAQRRSCWHTRCTAGK